MGLNDSAPLLDFKRKSLTDIDKLIQIKYNRAGE